MYLFIDLPCYNNFFNLITYLFFEIINFRINFLIKISSCLSLLYARETIITDSGMFSRSYVMFHVNTSIELSITQGLVSSQGV